MHTNSYRPRATSHCGRWLLVLAAWGLLPCGSAAQDQEDVHRVTIRGRVVDAEDLPISGATVYVADANSRWPSGVSGLRAETNSGNDGGYTLPDVPLRMLQDPGNPIPQPTEGKFQVVAVADGYGWAWRGVRSFRPGPRPADAAPASDSKEDSQAAPYVYYAGEPIELDLVMQREVRLHGQITDDVGNSLPGVKVQVGCIDDLRTGRTEGVTNVDYLERPANETEDEATRFAAIRWLPRAMPQTFTDNDGRYELRGVPRDARLIALISYGPTFEAKQLTVVTSPKPQERARSIGYEGELNEALLAPRPVIVHVSFENTNSPAPTATVRVRAEKILRGGNMARSNRRGDAELSLTPGEYTLIVEPPWGAPYLTTEAALTVPAGAIPEQKVSVPLPRGAEVELRAVDDTGAGVPGVQFLYETGSTRRRRELQSQTVIVDHPRTGSNGLLRAIVPPGTMRFVVGEAPPSYKGDDAPGDLIEFSAGQTKRVQFLLRKKPLDTTELVDESALAPEFARLRELGRKQQAGLQQGRFRLRVNNFLESELSQEEIINTIDALEGKMRQEIVAALETMFPALSHRGMGQMAIVVDGAKRRVESSSPEKGEIRPQGVTVINGVEQITYSVDNAQVDVNDAKDSRRYAYGVHDFCCLPPLARFENGGLMPDVTAADGRFLVQWPGARNSTILRADERTGFVHREIAESPGGARVRWQLLPRTLDGGVVVPGVHIRADFQEGRLSRATIFLIEEAVLGPPPGDAFVMAVPAGTYIIDYRGGDGQRPHKQSVVREPLTDVVKSANDLAPNPSVEPILQPGEPAPRLEPQVWLNQSGKIEPPELSGKIVLVNFWATSCGPCIGEIPEIAQAARYFEKDGVVVIGLHAEGAEASELAEFARRKKINWPLGIDKSAAEGFFGAAFEAFGVHAIPSFAVIDRQGRFVYCGDLRRAAEHVRHLTK